MMRSIAKSPQTSKTPSNTVNDSELKEIQRWEWKNQGQPAVETEKKVVRTGSKEINQPQQNSPLLQCPTVAIVIQVVKETRKFQIQEALYGMTSTRETESKASHVATLLGWNRSLMKCQKHVT